MGNTDVRHENALKLDLNHKITSEEESVMEQQQMKVAAADFSPHACLTCTLRWDLSSFSAHSKWKREEHLLPGESRRHAAETLLFFLGRFFLLADSSSALLSETSGQTDPAVVFSARNSRQQRSAKGS